MKKRITEYKFYRNTVTGSVYRTIPITFSDGTPGLKVERFNWDMENWNGHIHDHDKTRAQLKEGVTIIPITEEELIDLIK